MSSLRPWVVWHIPHASTAIPPAIRGQFLLFDDELRAEAELVADTAADALYVRDGDNAVIFTWSRLVLDPERLRGDAEPMEKHGLGMIYRRTHDGRQLRRELTQAEEQLLVDHYRVHHAQLTDSVKVDIARYGFCLILDGHTYPPDPLPFEDPSMDRPPVCLGTDPTHTPDWLVQAFVDAFHDHGIETGINTPYSGTLVPEQYQGDTRATSLMIEVRKDCYSTGIRDAVELAVAKVGSVAMANRRHTPRCPVAEFAKFEDNLVYQARARHLRDYQSAKAAGLPLPDLFDYMPTADQLPFTAFGREWLKK